MTVMERPGLRAFLLFPAGLLVGAALAWVVLADGDAAAPDPRPAPPPPATAGSPPAPTAVGTGAPAGGPAGAEAPDPEEADRARALIVLFRAAAAAIEGRGDDLRREVADALATGASDDQVLGLLPLLPEPARPPFLAALAAAGIPADWSGADLAEEFTAAGLAKEAVALLEAALTVEGGDPMAVLRRLADADPVRTAELYRRIALERNLPPDDLIQIAEVLRERDHPELARPFIEMVLAAEPTHLYAIELLAAADPQAGLAAAEAATRQDPESAGAWAKLAELRVQAGDKAAAFEAYRQAAALERDEDNRRTYLVGLLTADPKAALPLIRKYAAGAGDETVGILGRALVANGFTDEAFEVFMGAHRMDASDSEWLHRLVAIDPALAEQRLKEEIENGGAEGNDELRGTFANALFLQGRAEEAYEHYLLAHAQDDTDWEWLRGLARASPGRAATLLESLRDESPESENVLGALGDAYAGLGRKTEAAEQYLKAIEAGGSEPRWLGALAAVEPARGLPMLEAALAAEKNNDELWGALGDAYRTLGRMEEARAAYEKALDLDPSDWEWNMRRDQVR